MTEIVNAQAAKPAKKKGSKKWLIILAIMIILNVLVVQIYKPIPPHIAVAPENILFNSTDGELVERPWFTLPIIGNVYLTNSLASVAVIYIILALLALEVHRQTSKGQLQLHGVALLLEFVISALCNMAESSVPEKWRRKILPFFMAIFFYVAIANLSKLLPIYETIGWAAPVAEHGFLADKWANWFYAVTNIPADGEGFKVISFLRGGPTDLNFTLGIAISAVFAIQVVGVQAKGVDYFSKFINIKAIIKNPKMGFIDFIVGILELIAEIAKIASFGFRLFGNMFAGMVLLMFLGYMTPILISSGILLYEVFVGLLQALIFGMLTTVFMGMAVSESH